IEALSMPKVPPPPRVDAEPKHAHPVAPVVSRRASRGMIIGGGVAVGVAVAGAIGLFASLQAGRRAEADYEAAQGDYPGDPNGSIADADRRGRRANRGLIASATFLALGAAIGIPVLTAGLVARRRNIRATPTAGRGYAGAQLGFAF
ncbi:MAG TPA: hypothetical protein VG755_17735, partial [Nannocystaceae bacterium]|nr:hypothetical protein [Nannocystaceae bacterium]